MQFTIIQKRILYVVGLIVAAIIFGFLIYTMFFSKPDQEYVNVNGEMIPINIFPEINLNANRDITEDQDFGVSVPDISEVANGGQTATTAIVEDSVQDAILSGNGRDMNYYDPEKGKFYRVTEDGEKISLTDDIFKGVEKANWSNDANEAVLEFEDGHNLYYDFEKRKQYSLPKEMEDFTFSPADDQIGFKYMGLDEEDRWLGVINPDGSNPRGIERLGDNEHQVQVDWSPSGKAIGTYNDFIDGERQKVIPLGLHGENFKQMTVHGKGFEYEWSDNGKQMLYNTYGDFSDFKPTLWIVDAEGDEIGNNRTALELNTWVEKCTFGSSTDVYCAVPESLPTGAGFSRDIADEIPDSIYKIDLKTGTKDLLAIPIDDFNFGKYTIESMQVSNDGSTLYFTDKANQNIHKVKLK